MDLRTDTVPSCTTATFSGVLDRGAARWWEDALRSLLAPARTVVLDVTGVRVSYPPAVAALSRTLLDAGGWPAARLLVVGADPRFRAALRSTGAERDVVVADDEAHGQGCPTARPTRIRRRTSLPGGPRARRLAHRFVDAAAADWHLPGPLVSDIRRVVGALVVDAPQTQRVLLLALDDTGLRVTVRDFDGGPRSGCAPVTPRLASVTHLVVDHVVTPRSDGQQVCALLPLPAAEVA